MDNLSSQKGSLNLPMWSWLETVQRERRIRTTMRTEWRLLRPWWGGVFLDSAISPRYPQVVHRTLKLVTHEESQMESPRDDNLNLDNNDMYTVTNCRCLMVQTLC